MTSTAPPLYDRGLMWFRRDLRSEDNAALCQALRQCRQLWCVFVFDTEILEPLQARGLHADRRVEFIRESLLDLNEQLQALGHSVGTDGVQLIVRHAQARHDIPRLATQLHVQAVFANHDDEPQALARDAQVRGDLAHAGIRWHSFKDHVVFERAEVSTRQGGPYSVFTPYKQAWLKQLEAAHMAAHPVERFATALAPCPDHLRTGIPTLEAIGHAPSNLRQLPIRTGSRGAQALLEDFMARIAHYQEARDFPGRKGPSYLSVHLRFGTISIRALLRAAWPLHLQGQAGASTWLSELIWREFYHQILARFPHVSTRAFKPAYDQIHWVGGALGAERLAAWCQGRTGYPLVDAAMRQLNQTGYMHNRLRMVTASFLCKDLGVDWRLGEGYFADHLIDFDLAANNGGWQWASSSGCDAQPFFRIFNPVTQSQRFDPDGRFIRRYVPELAGLSDRDIHAPWEAHEIERTAAGVQLGPHYPLPVVDHATARLETLERYAVVKRPEA